MRNVTRLVCPDSLREKGEEWTKELLKQVKECNKARTKVRKMYYNRYNKKDIKSRLSEMYEKLCCYCEGDLGITDKGQVEHRFPKRDFPELCYEWENLHWSCPNCNRSKGDQCDPKYPVLDASRDNPITDHLGYDYDKYVGVVCRHISCRGKTTIDFTGLNRIELREARRRTCRDISNLIRDIRENPDSPYIEERKRVLRDKAVGPFGSAVIWYCNHLGYSLESKGKFREKDKTR